MNISTKRNRGAVRHSCFSKVGFLVMSLVLLLLVTAAASAESQSLDQRLQVTDQQELAAVQRAQQLVAGKGGKPRIVATSTATVEICRRLHLDLVGLCSSTVTKIPKEYKKLPKVGTAMSPDMEKVSALQPDWILSPISLSSDLKPKYDAVNSQYAFLNLNSVEGMYRSIWEMGQIFDRSKEAEKLIQEFKTFYNGYQKKNSGKKKPKVMVLMGLPGSYIIATPKSYVGNLVELAGGENVYQSEEQAFLNVNTEDMKNKEPDVILRAAHALPDQVIEMFDKDFKENSIWKHFQAVRQNRVFDLTYENFGMSANFNYPKALEELQPMLYPENAEDIKKAKKASHHAKDKAKKSKGKESYEKIQKGDTK